jgi:hypothetical protein
MSINQYVFFGERCSGTNFLEEAINANFDITYSHEFGNKHFFGFNKYNASHDNTLFIGIVRNPIYWLNSFHVELHNIPKQNQNLKNFLFSPFYSVEKTNTTNQMNQEKSNFMFPIKQSQEYILQEDLNYINRQKYRNIFELRKLKNNYLMNMMPKMVKNYILINYEDLLYNYEDTLATIRDIFRLKPLHNTFQKIVKYKKSETYKFVAQRQILFPPNLLPVLWMNLDREQERLLGYEEGVDNTSFKTSSIASRLSFMSQHPSQGG